MLYVIFVRPSASDGPIRVVESTNPKQTKEEMEACSPVLLTLIGSAPAASWPIRWWRDRLAPWKHREGWYMASEQVVGFIDAALTGRLKKVGEDYDIPEAIPKIKKQIVENGPPEGEDQKTIVEQNILTKEPPLTKDELLDLLFKVSKRKKTPKQISDEYVQSLGRGDRACSKMLSSRLSVEKE